MILLTIGKENYPDFTVKIEDESQLLKQIVFLKTNFPEKEINIWRRQEVSFKAKIDTLTFDQEI